MGHPATHSKSKRSGPVTMPISRREFLGTAAGAVAFGPLAWSAEPISQREFRGKELAGDVVIIGGSLGGCAAAFKANLSI
jgi:hypothetical protein